MKNLHEHTRSVHLKSRIAKNGHLPCVVWLTGLSGSGKSTIANVLETKLFDMNVQTCLLDGDSVRMGLNRDLGFLPHERKENIRRVGEVANLFAESGTITITAFISPYAEDRLAAREASSQQFLEVFVDTPLNVCEDRDPKGLYKKARTGLIPEFTGVSSPYEPPKPEDSLVINTTVLTASECADVIITTLISMSVLRNKNE
jgi:adenylylsulfate kinase